MIEPNLLLLVKDTLPKDLCVNAFGVICNYLEMSLSENSEEKGILKLHVCRINGVWRGTSSYFGQNSGFSSPLSELYDKPFPDITTLVVYLWEEFLVFKDSCDKDQGSVNYKVSKFPTMKKFIEKWLSLSEEEKLKCFHEEKI